MLLPVLLAGGSGTRLWPLSRAARPKQLVATASRATMLQETASRLQFFQTRPPIAVCGENHRFQVAEQLKEAGAVGPIIVEPVARNTAPAIAIAALTADPDDLLLVLPADHLIGDEKLFAEAVKKGVSLAESGNLVTFGVAPITAHTGYGYLKTGSEIGQGLKVTSFKEKPDSETATKYLEDGGYYWNSGMFLFRARNYLEHLERCAPEIYQASQASHAAITRENGFLQIDLDTFQQCPSESIDCAVMEKTDAAVVVPLEAGWSDVGSWSSLWESSSKDKHGNHFLGDVIARDIKDCFIRSESLLVAAIGVEDLVVVATDDVVLVSSKQNERELKSIVDEIRDSERPEWEYHRKVNRPWGSFDSIDRGAKDQVKRITVKPGHRLSVQKHHHRSEHWIVVSGQAKVRLGQEEFFLAENQSTFIPQGEVHSLENPGDTDLEIIEVQFGAYLGEDDIVRIDDVYGRT